MYASNHKNFLIERKLSEIKLKKKPTNKKTN